MKKDLPSVTLLGADCVDIDRLIQAAEICTKDFNFASVKLLTSLPSDHKDIVAIDPIKSTEEYSQFCITRMHEYVDTAHVLIIQYDGFILNPDAWSDKYLEYDYIGAPMPLDSDSLTVGNGGFTLRSQKLLCELAQMSNTNAISKYHPEDVVICKTLRPELEAKGITFAPVALAQQFSFEGLTEQDYTWDGQFGFHGLQWTDITKWKNEHSEYSFDVQFDVTTL